MTIQVTPGHFKLREEAVAQIESDGLRFIETEITPDQLTPTPHAHAYRVDIYLLEGMLELHEPGTGLTHRLEAGSRTMVPAETLHAEYSPAGFRAAIGLSDDPAAAEPDQG